MKIKSTRFWREDFELVRPYRIAFKQADRVTNFFCRLETETGNVGLGAAAPNDHVTGETIDDCANALLNADFSWLENADVNEFESLLGKVEQQLSKTPAARAAVDIALHDLRAQSANLPLVELLGRAHKVLPTSITIGIKSVEETLKEAEEYVGRGFTCLKLKLGENPELDIERTLKLHDAFGSRCKIRVDINQDYDVDQFLNYFEKTKRTTVEFFEQPVAADSVETLCSLDDKLRKKICIDESLLTVADAKRLAKMQAGGIFNIKLMKCGGIRPGCQIADIAYSSGIDLMWGCMDESRISIAAALHAAFASPATKYIDLDGSLDLERDVVSGGFEITQGMMRTLDVAGLGVKEI